jgi:hypothetical protein
MSASRPPWSSRRLPTIELETRSFQSRPDSAANSPARRRPIGDAIWKPAFLPATRTPGVASACRTRNPALDRKASETRKTRASRRRDAASPMRNPRAKVTTPVSTTSQK